MMSDISRPEITDSQARPGPAEWLLITIGSALLLANVLTARPLQSANDRSRWETVWSLVERGTYQIDEIDAQPGWTTIDKVLHEGHLYSTKPPLMPTAVAGVYWTVKEATGLDLLRQTDDTTRLVLAIVNWLPLTLAFVVMARVLARSSGNATARLLALGTFCFGTLVTPYATVLNNHSIAAVCAVFAMAPALRILNEESRRGIDFALAGFWAALVSCCELPAALFGLLLFVLMCRRSVIRTVVWFVPAALIPLAAYFVTNWIATGGWKPFYLFYGTEKYLFEIDGVRSYWHEPRGMDQSLDSPFTYFVHCTIGHHGIFSLTPIFVLTVLTWCRRSWWEYSRLRPAVWMGALLTVAVLGFYLTRTQNYNYGGNTFGLRWMIWLVPFWTLSLVPALEQLSRKRGRLILVLCLLAGSVFSSVAAARNPWASSWLFDQMEQAGWIDYSNPPPKFSFDRELHTIFAELPEEAGTWIEFASADRSGGFSRQRSYTLRLQSRRRFHVGDIEVQPIDFDWNNGRPDARSMLVMIDVQAFYAGKTVAEQVLVPGGQIDVFEHHPFDEAFTWLRGVPGDRAYVPQTPRHIRTPLRTEAFRCQRAATQVRFGKGDKATIRRCELWLTDEVPFGVAQFEMSESDARTGELLFKRRFVVRATSRR
jgi:hypothetical protein